MLGLFHTARGTGWFINSADNTLESPHERFIDNSSIDHCKATLGQAHLEVETIVDHVLLRCLTSKLAFQSVHLPQISDGMVSAYPRRNIHETSNN